MTSTTETYPRAEDIARRTIVMILAGGEGQRLHPLTRDRAKPAVPFGGHYRVIDFALSNCVNSQLRRIHVLTQYKSMSLDRHIHMGWNVYNRELNEYIDVIPPQKRAASGFYRGTADAIFQNIYTLEKERPRWVLILSGDHVYKMDYRKLLMDHVRHNSTVTVACHAVPKQEAGPFGVIQVDDDWLIRDFEEKPADPATAPGLPDRSLVSMGIYVFNTEELVRRVCEDARHNSHHDFGCDILPALVVGGKTHAYLFRGAEPREGSPAYWRDIGTIDSYYAANMELVEPEPLLNIHTPGWPVRTYHEQRPPAKFISSEVDGGAGSAVNSIVASGCLIRGGLIERSVLSAGVRVNSRCHVSDSILLEDVEVGQGATIHRAIIDKGVKIPDGEKIGVDPELDRRRFTVSPNGIVVVPKEMLLSNKTRAINGHDPD